MIRSLIYFTFLFEDASRSKCLQHHAWLQFAALIALSFATIINILLGLLPHVDNFSSLGGFISGFLLGFVLFIDPRLGKRAENKGGLLGNSIESSISLKHKLDRPVLRSASLVLVAIM